MATRLETMKVTDDNAVGPLLADANDGPLLLEKNGIVYRLSRVDEVEDVDEVDDWPEPDPERIEQMLDKVSGSWADIDADALIAELYEARERGSRPWDHPRPGDIS